MKIRAALGLLTLAVIIMSAPTAYAGRFLTEDPKGTIDGPNMYAFCGDDPVNTYS